MATIMSHVVFAILWGSRKREVSLIIEKENFLSIYKITSINEDGEIELENDRGQN